MVKIGNFTLFERRKQADKSFKMDFIRTRKEAVKGKELVSYAFTDRKDHPNNMGEYEDWSNDPEASSALAALTSILTGGGYQTKVEVGDGEYDENHPNKQLVDEVAAELNFDETIDVLAEQTLSKGFAPTELSWGYDGQLDDWVVLPSETFYIYTDRRAKVQKYTQEESRQIITTWTEEEMMDIVLFFNQKSPTRTYGKSILDSIGSLLDMREELNGDMAKGVHRWANPIPILETSKSRSNSTELKKSLEDREADDWVLVYDVVEGELRWQPLTVEPSARFVPYVEMIYNQVAEGLHAPLLLYLKNATEASAHVVMESIYRLNDKRQRHIKRRMEGIYGKIVRSGPVPKHIWNKLGAGVDNMTVSELTMLLNSPSLAWNQKAWMLKQRGIELPAPDWKSGPPPELMMQNQPSQPQPTAKPRENRDRTELIISKLNDLTTSLNVIYENHHAGTIKISEARKLAERTITAHMQRAYPDNWEERVEVKLQEFVQEKLLNGKSKDVTVGI